MNTDTYPDALFRAHMLLLQWGREALAEEAAAPASLSGSAVVATSEECQQMPALRISWGEELIHAECRHG